MATEQHRGRKIILPDGTEASITHIMADGSIRDSVEGYPVPYSQTTATAYHLLAKWMAEAAEPSGQEPAGSGEPKA